MISVITKFSTFIIFLVKSLVVIHVFKYLLPNSKSSVSYGVQLAYWCSGGVRHSACFSTQISRLDGDFDDYRIFAHFGIILGKLTSHYPRFSEFS